MYIVTPEMKHFRNLSELFRRFCTWPNFVTIQSSFHIMKSSRLKLVLEPDQGL